MSAILTTEQINTLMTHVMRNPSLRQALLDNPHAAVQSQLGVDVPSGKTLYVVEASPDRPTIVIPMRPADWSETLSAADVAEKIGGDLSTLDDQSRKMAQMQARLIGRAWQNDAFKQRLLSDAHSTISQELGVTLPADFNVQFLSNDAEHQYMVLPPVVDAQLLTDEQLEQVAGGEVLGAVVATCFVTMGGTIAWMATSW